jgi:peptidoglycan-associated lipoprotein
MRSIGLAALSAAALLASACASNPPAPTPPAAAPAPPVATRPAPVTPPPAPSGPSAGTKADFEAKATDRVYFDYDQYNLDDADRRALATQVAWLKQYPGAKVQVEGNADERGTREYNIALGARRANAVAEYLKGQGVTGDRVSTISWGKDKPLDPGHDDGAWSRNRNSYTNVVSGAVS